MKLLVISMLYEPDCVGIAPIASDMCAELAVRGHEVTVCTTYPYYPEWRVKVNRAPVRVQHEVIHDVHVQRYKIFVPRNPSRLLPRLLHELSFPFSLLRSLFLGGRYDCVMVFCPLMGSVAFAGIRRLLFRERLWVNIQDIPVEAATASGIMSSGWMARLAAWLQAFVLNRADCWSTISRDMIRRLEKLNRGRRPIYWCPNWLSGSLADEVGRLPSKIGRELQAPPKLLYCGTIGKKQGLLELCQALTRQAEPFLFKIYGAGGEASRVQEWLAARSDPRFQFGPLLPEPDFVRAIHEADLFVVPQRSSAGSAFFPSKLMPALSVGTPILAITDPSGPLYEEVHDYRLGPMVTWQGVESLSATFSTLLRDPVRMLNWQQRCVERATAYDRTAAIDRIEQLLQSSSPFASPVAGQPACSPTVTEHSSIHETASLPR